MLWLRLPEWILRWVLSVASWLNAFPQVWQMNGLSPASINTREKSSLGSLRLIPDWRKNRRTGGQTNRLREKKGRTYTQTYSHYTTQKTPRMFFFMNAQCIMHWYHTNIMYNAFCVSRKKIMSVFNPPISSPI